MTSKTDSRLTPRQRLGRGLAYTAVGPVDVTRGALGIGAQSLAATAAGIRRQYRKSQLRHELAAAQDTLARELAAAQEVVAALPQVIQDARGSRRRPRKLLVVGGGLAVVALGAVAFSVIRRSQQPEPSTLPPSVQVEPRP
ncbi:cell wall synthesis protein CwsA [soil metagenome]